MPGPQFRFVDELVRVGAVFERSLRAEQKRVNVRRRSALHEFTRQFELRREQRRVIRALDLRRKIKPAWISGV